MKRVLDQNEDLRKEIKKIISMLLKDNRDQELKKERGTVASGIDEDLLDRFDRLFASKGDAAVVALEHDVCTGCHMRVTTGTAMRVKDGKEIVSFKQWGRTLYNGT